MCWCRRNAGIASTNGNRTNFAGGWSRRPRGSARRPARRSSLARLVSASASAGCPPAAASARTNAGRIGVGDPVPPARARGSRSEAPGPGKRARATARRRRCPARESRCAARRVLQHEQRRFRSRPARRRRAARTTRRLPGRERAPANVRIWTACSPARLSVASSSRCDHPQQAAAREGAQQRCRERARRAAARRRRRGMPLPARRLPSAPPRRAPRACSAQQRRRTPHSSTSNAAPARPTQSPQGTISVGGGSRTGTSPITSVRSPMRGRGEHGARRVDHGADAVGGDAQLRQARLDAAECRHRQVQFAPPCG